MLSGLVAARRAVRVRLAASAGREEDQQSAQSPHVPQTHHKRELTTRGDSTSLARSASTRSPQAFTHSGRRPVHAPPPAGGPPLTAPAAGRLAIAPQARASTSTFTGQSGLAPTWKPAVNQAAAWQPLLVLRAYFGSGMGGSGTLGGSGGSRSGSETIRAVHCARWFEVLTRPRDRESSASSGAGAAAFAGEY